MYRSDLPPIRAPEEPHVCSTTTAAPSPAPEEPHVYSARTAAASRLQRSRMFVARKPPSSVRIRLVIHHLVDPRYNEARIL